MAVNLKELVKNGVFDIELNTIDPTLNGYKAGDGAMAKSSDGRRWIKTGPHDKDWSCVTTSNSVSEIIQLTRSEYEALPTRQDGVLYNISDDGISGIDPSWGSSFKGNPIESTIPAFIPRQDDHWYRLFDESGNELYAQYISLTESASTCESTWIPAINAVLDTQPANAKIWVVTHGMSHLHIAKETARPNHDIILSAENNYGRDGSANLTSADFLGIKGSAEYPVTFRAMVLGQAKISYPAHSRLLRMWDCAYLNFKGIRFGKDDLDVVGDEENEGSNPTVMWGVVLGQAWGTEGAPNDGDGNPYSSISHDLTFETCEIGPAGQALFIIASSSYNIALKYCKLRGSGYRWARKHNAEGIYIGSGANAEYTSTAHVCHDIYIKGCDFSDIGRDHSGGEAIDMKNQTYNVTVEDCGFNGVNVASQGCITVCYNVLKDTDWNVNNGTANVLIHRNTFTKITKRGLVDFIPPEHSLYDSLADDPNNPPARNAHGIHVGKNGVYVIDNTFIDVEDDNISIELTEGNDAGTIGDVLLKGNKPNAFTFNGGLTGTPLNVIQE